MGIKYFLTPMRYARYSTKINVIKNVDITAKMLLILP